MAIIVSTNAQITIGSTDFSDHCKSVRVNDGQESRDVTAMGHTTRRFRAGVGTARIEATFYNDLSSGQISQALKSLVSVASTGFDVTVRKVNAARGASNPEYQMTAIIDGDVNVFDENHGDVSELTVAFIPYSTFTLVTTSS